MDKYLIERAEVFEHIDEDDMEALVLAFKLGQEQNALAIARKIAEDYKGVIL